MRTTSLWLGLVIYLSVGASSLRAEIPASTEDGQAGSQSSPAPAKTQPSIRTYTFDHYLQKDGGTSVTQLQPNESFNVVLSHTCTQAFEYSIYKSPHVAQKDGSQAPSKLETKQTPPHNPVGTVTKGPTSHDPQWGSYILQVRRKAGNQDKCDVWVDETGTPVAPSDDALSDVNYKTGGHWEQNVVFQDASYIVAVQTDDWEIGADAALVFTGNVDRKYMTAPDPAAPTTKKVVAEDTDGESSGRISFGTLTHLYPPGLKYHGMPMGPVIGFSVLSSQNNQTEYYFGWGGGFGPRGGRLNWTFGAAYAPVPMLPVGIHTTDPIIDATTIATLRNVYHWRAFFGVTATAFKAGDNSTSKPPAPNPPTPKP